MAKWLRRLLLTGLAGAVFFGVAYWQFLHWLDAPGPARQTELVVLQRGEGLGPIAVRLQDRGVISSRHLFQLAAIWLDVASALKAGEYAIDAAATPREILNQIALGRVFRRRLTIPEGSTSAEILQMVRKAEAMSGDPGSEPLPEGRLLPETYQYVYADDRLEMLRRMARARDELLARLWQQRAADLPLESEAQAVILASMIEAETPKADERPVVASVFINRLRRGMRLQSDPTVIYGMTLGRYSLEQPLTRADLQKATPWNTYVIDGLPPTPINHPGRASLVAALNPAATRFLYFVADGRGGHVFAETYDQHLKNVAAYRAQQTGKN